jgi:hypothetical protein
VLCFLLVFVLCAMYPVLPVLGLPLWYLQALLWLSLRFFLKFILTWKLIVRNYCDPYCNTIDIFSNFLIVNFPFIYSNLPVALCWIVIIIYSKVKINFRKNRRDNQRRAWRYQRGNPRTGKTGYIAHRTKTSRKHNTEN